MTTTSFDDQFTVGTQTIVLHQAYGTVAILRRNVADLEVALRKQTERAESAEQELAKLAQQEPVAWKHENGNLFLSWQKDLIVTGAKFSPLYTAPVPAPAVPATCNDILQVDIREMLQWLIDQRGKHGHNHKQSGIWDDDNGAMAGKPCEACAMYDKARALLQSAEVTDNAAADRLLEGGE